MFQSGFTLVDMALWSTNGLVQSAAWPALAAIFMNWFDTSPNRGIWYSILSTNQNVGSALTPVLLTPLVAAYGWRAAVVGPGVFSLAYAVLLLLFTQESPEEEKEQEEKDAAKGAGSKQTVTNNGADNPPSKPKSWADTLAELVTSPALLSLGVGYAFLTMIRVGMQDWSLMILQETRGVPMEVARDCMVALELGGFIGGVSAGAVSDRIFQGRRGPAMVLFMVLLAPVLAAIAWMPIPDTLSPRVVLSVLYFLFGFTSFGPHMLVGLTAREVFPQAPATAGAFTKGVAQVGGTFAGYPTSLLVGSYGWLYCVGFWTVSAGMGAAAFTPLLSVKAYVPDANGATNTKKTQ
jgi:OPA family sugar phosphate sensor protein UhpC-like MFS transporter